MTTQDYRTLIVEGIDGLPPDALAEIADFVFFVRRRVAYPQRYRDELDSLSLRLHRSELSEQEQAHLESEFEGYDELYPRE